MNMFVLAGQFIIGLVFVVAVAGDVIDRKNLLVVLDSKLELLLKRKFAHTSYLLYGSMALKIICGLALMFNILAPAAAFFLAGFAIVANFLLNDFWAQHGDARKQAYLMFLIHWAIIGGLIALIGA